MHYEFVRNTIDENKKEVFTVEIRKLNGTWEGVFHYANSLSADVLDYVSLPYCTSDEYSTMKIVLLQANKWFTVNHVKNKDELIEVIWYNYLDDTTISSRKI